MQQLAWGSLFTPIESNSIEVRLIGESESRGCYLSLCMCQLRLSITALADNRDKALKTPKEGVLPG